MQRRTAKINRLIWRSSSSSGVCLCFLIPLSLSLQDSQHRLQGSVFLIQVACELTRRKQMHVLSVPFLTQTHTHIKYIYIYIHTYIRTQRQLYCVCVCVCVFQAQAGVSPCTQVTPEAEVNDLQRKLGELDAEIASLVSE